MGKSTLFAIALITILRSSAISAPLCTADTLASYINLGSAGCAIGGGTLSGFQTLTPITGAVAVAAGDITITPVQTGALLGIDVTTRVTAMSGDLIEALFGYMLAAPSINSSSVTVTGVSATGGAFVTGIQNYCAGGTFLPGDVTGCNGPASDALVVLNAGTQQAAFAPVSQINVVHDFTFDASSGGMASGGMVIDRFGVAGAAPVPEPQTYLLMSSALLILAAWSRRRYKPCVAGMLALSLSAPPATFAASHREAPITALDQKADITDVYAFVSYDNPNMVTLMLNVDPFLEPANGPNYFPFDPNILYAIRIDNNHDAIEDIVFEVQFQTEVRAPGIFTAFVGLGAGVNAPSNSPAPVPPGTPIIPPAITSLDGPGSEGFNLRQTYTVTMVKNGVRTVLMNTNGQPLFAVPTNVGPRTMPNYAALAQQGIYSLNHGIRSFAGTVDDPFWIDLGAAFDSLNFRAAVGGGVLSPAQDVSEANFAPDAVSGFNVNTIAIEVPIAMLTRTGTKVSASHPAATIGVFGSTSRRRLTVRRAPLPSEDSGAYSQVQRMGNALINELLIGTGFKNRWSMSQPKDDQQFASVLLDPLLARVFNAAFGINIPAAPRTDLLPLVTYAPPIAAQGTPPGPVADLLRLNTGIAPTPAGARRRLGLLAGDAAGFPNGRRVSDDVTDIAARVVAGVLNPNFNVSPNNRIGDGVNVNDTAYQETFPYAGFAQSGRDRRHIDPGEPGCTQGAGNPCAVQ